MNGPEVIVLVGVLLVAGGALAPRIHLPAPVVWLLAGVTVGFIPGVDHVELPPEAVLLVFLPAILYWESLVDDCGPNETPDSLLRRDAELEAELRSALLADKRNAVIKLRDQRRIDDIVLRRIQGRLDREEVRVGRLSPRGRLKG
jgi:hypothetical protein